MGSHRGEAGRAQVTSNGRVRTAPRACLLVLVLSLVGAFVAAHPATAASPAGADQQQGGLEIVYLAVHDAGGLPALFGASAERTLRVTVRNTSAAPIKAVATARLRAGSSSTTPIRPSGEVVIRPDETVTIELPFQLDTMAIGETTVEGEVTSTRETVAFAATTAQWPWGLALIAIAIAGLLWLGIRAIVRRWRRRREGLAALQDAGLHGRCHARRRMASPRGP